MVMQRPLVFQVLISWLFGDRIRVSPHQGKLLSLAAGDRICIRERFWIVVSREILIDYRSDDATPLELQYKLSEDGAIGDASAMLHVTFVANSSLPVLGVLSEGGGTVEDVYSDELVVL
jgi:hypothetical protein